MNNKTKNTAVPELRFPEFQGTGEWEETTLGSNGQFLRGLTYNSTNICDDGLLVLRSSNIQNNRLILDKDLVFVNTDCPPLLLMRKGDIAICMSNGSKALVGKNAEFNGEYKNHVTVGAFCSLFRPYNDFAKLAFKTEQYESFVAFSIGGGNINNLKNSDLEQFSFSVPIDPREQQKIAECLSSLDELIAARSAKLEALKAYKRGLMQALFPAEGETVPKLRFPEFQSAGAWEEQALGDVGDVITGSTPSTADSENYGGEMLFVSPADISGERYVAQTKTTLSAKGYKKTRTVKANSSLVVCIGSTIGKVAQNKIECATNQQINALVPYADNSSDFIYSALETITPKIVALAGRQAVPIVNKSTFSAITILIPSPAEQQKIADCLSSLDHLLAAQAQHLEALKQHKKGLMQGLFPVTAIA